MAPSTDIDNDAQKLQSIAVAFKNLGEGFNKEQDASKKILIPVAEQRKILGLFKRDHWVTLHYDPASRQATLLDSRPGFLSFLYPKSAMKTAFLNGIKALYGETPEIKFQTKYQGVQYNDTYCGAWTTRNILDLAGIGQSDKATTINEQIGKYKARDERAVVLMNQAVGGNVVDKPSFFQRFLAFIGLRSVYQDKVEAANLALGGKVVDAPATSGVPTISTLPRNPLKPEEEKFKKMSDSEVQSEFARLNAAKALTETKKDFVMTQVSPSEIPSSTPKIS